MKIEKILIKVVNLIKVLLILFNFSSCKSQSIINNIADVSYKIYFCEGFINDYVDLCFDNNCIDFNGVSTDLNSGFTSVILEIVEYRKEYYFVNRNNKREKKINLQDDKTFIIDIAINNKLRSSHKIIGREGYFILIDKKNDSIQIRQTFNPPKFE